MPSDGSITGRPYLWARLIGVEPFQRGVLQGMAIQPKAPNAWGTMQGIFRVPEGASGIQLMIGQPARERHAAERVRRSREGRGGPPVRYAAGGRRVPEPLRSAIRLRPLNKPVQPSAEATALVTVRDHFDRTTMRLWIGSRCARS